jgi:hypothetical protein
MEELQKKFDESAALLDKTWIQLEEMKLLQAQIEAERKRIQPAQRKTSD